MERLPEIAVLPEPDASKLGDVHPHVRATLPSELVDAVLPVVGIFSAFFEHISAKSLPQAMLGLTALLARDAVEQALGQDAPAPASARHAALLDDALRYMRLSSVAYGHFIVNPVMFHDKAIVPESLDVFHDPAALVCHHTGLDKASIRVVHFQSGARLLQPAHLVVHDMRRREAVVVVRGTLSVADVVADLGADEVDFFLGGKAHRNILLSACNVLRSVAPALEQLAGQVDSIVFTGHSLGGGVAAYAAALCTELLDDGQAPHAESTPEVRCFSFGSPGLCSLEVSCGLRDRITSFCHAHDIVPRLSFGHVLELHDRALAAAEGRREGPDASSLHSGKKLYPAGRCFLLHGDGSLAEVEPKALAPCISLAGGRRLVADHLPPQYEAALRVGRLLASADAAPNM